MRKKLFLFIVFIIQRQLPIIYAQNLWCQKVDFNRSTSIVNEFGECFGESLNVLKINAYATTTIVPFRPTSQFHLSATDAGLSCLQSTSRFTLDENSEIRTAIFLNGVEFGAWVRVQILDENGEQVEVVAYLEQSEGWSAFYGKINRSIENAQIEIRTNLNLDNILAIEYVFVLNSGIQDDECVDADPPGSGEPTDNPETEVPTTDDPETELPTTDDTETELPTTDDPETELPTTDNPETEVPTTDNTETEVPTTDDPETEVPTTDDPETELPTTEDPETELPTTDDPETELPTTEDPETELPTTEDPETELPTTDDSETELPTTEDPETELPTTEDLETELPTTEDPETELPTTDDPETELPTTDDPETELPSDEPEITDPTDPDNENTEPTTTTTASLTPINSSQSAVYVWMSLSLLFFITTAVTLVATYYFIWLYRNLLLLRPSISNNTENMTSLPRLLVIKQNGDHVIVGMNTR